MDYTGILIKLRKIIRSLNIESRKIQDDYGISIPQFLVLRYLSEQEEYKATHTDISKTLELNKSTVSGILGRLEKKNYIARLPWAEDKRVSLAALTSEGYKIVKQTPALLHDLLSTRLKELPVDELENIDHSLNVLIRCFEIEDLHASPVITINDPIGASGL